MRSLQSQMGEGAFGKDLWRKEVGNLEGRQLFPAQKNELVNMQCDTT